MATPRSRESLLVFGSSAGDAQSVGSTAGLSHGGSPETMSALKKWTSPWSPSYFESTLFPYFTFSTLSPNLASKDALDVMSTKASIACIFSSLKAWFHSFLTLFSTSYYLNLDLGWSGKPHFPHLILSLIKLEDSRRLEDFSKRSDLSRQESIWSR